jgi:YihY family inner membrane protein
VSSPTPSSRRRRRRSSPDPDSRHPPSEAGAGSPVGRLVDRADRLQKRHALTAFPFAVGKRYTEDHGGWLGATITYYGFFALVPLLLVFVTALTIALNDNPTLLNRILDAVWRQLPFVGDDIRESVKPITGNPWTIAVASLVTLWGASNVMRVCQDTMNQMWGIPLFERPHFAAKVARGIAVIGLLGLGLIGTAVITGLTLGFQLPLVGAIATGVGTIVLNVLIALALFRLLIARTATWREHLPGAVLVGIGTYGLTLLGGVYIQRVVARASTLYGSFAAMVGVFAWIALIVQVVVIATLVNVVRVERLWPRSISGRNFGAGDRRAFALSARRAQLIADATQPAPG